MEDLSSSRFVRPSGAPVFGSAGATWRGGVSTAAAEALSAQLVKPPPGLALPLASDPNPRHHLADSSPPAQPPQDYSRVAEVKEVPVAKVREPEFVREEVDWLGGDKTGGEMRWEDVAGTNMVDEARDRAWVMAPIRFFPSLFFLGLDCNPGGGGSSHPAHSFLFVENIFLHIILRPTTAAIGRDRPPSLPFSCRST